MSVIVVWKFWTVYSFIQRDSGWTKAGQFCGSYYLHVRLMSRSSPVLVTFSWSLIGRFKCQALVLLVPANFQAPRPARVTLFPALSGSRIFCSCPAGVCLECQARVRLLSGLTFSYGVFRVSVTWRNNPQLHELAVGRRTLHYIHKSYS